MTAFIEEIKSYGSLIKKESIIYAFDTAICMVFSFSLITSQVNPVLSYFCLKTAMIMAIFRLLADANVRKPDLSIILLICLFELAQLITSFTSVDPAQSITTFKIRTVYFVSFFIPVFFIRDMKQLKIIIASLILSTSFISAVEIVLFSKDLIATHFYPSEYRINYFNHAITGAEIKMVVILTGTALLLEKQEIVLSKRLIFILLIPVFAAFLFSGSRGPFIALAICFMILGWLKNKKIILGTLIFLAVYFFILPPTLNGRIASIPDQDNRSTKARVYMFETGIEIAKDNLFFGVGSIELRDVYKKYKIATITGEGEQLHNNFIQLAVTMGLPGLLIWICLMFNIFKKQITAYKNNKRNNEYSLLLLSSVLSMIAFQICGIFDFNFADYPYVIPFWFTVSFMFQTEKAGAYS